MRRDLLPLLLLTSAVQAQTPLTSLPYTPALDPRFMNRAMQPCQDFYVYACGNWNSLNPIPADQARWDVYGKLTNENQRYLWGLLLEAGRTGEPRSPNQQKVGDFFHACMDEARVEKAGLTPIQADLDRIAGLKSIRDMAAWLAGRHLETYTGSMLFDFGSNQDFADSSQVIAFADAGGLGLPDRDYYTGSTAKSEEIRRKYVEHVTKMLALLGDSPANAQAGAAAVMRIETALAKVSLTRVEQRDPHNLFHKMTRAELRKLTPSFPWDVYIESLHAPAFDTVNVTQPAFYRELDRQLTITSLADLKTYLRWHLIHSDARFLPSAFVQEDFNFFSKYLRGVPEMQPRWKRCVQLMDHTLGDALGQVFVEKTFTPETKSRALELTRGIESAMQTEIEKLDWMSAPTKQQALLKLHAVRNKIGYPDQWRDYSAVEIRRDDYLGDLRRAAIFESRRQLNKIGKPVDKSEWLMSAPTVNAYFDPQMNDINFPAGVLQPPLFDPKMDDAPNFGNTGGTIGHELTHGFDDEGRQFDASGNLRDWWTKSDADEFSKRAECIVDEYSKFTMIDDIRVNGRLTLGENIADLGGEILAWNAWKNAERGKDLKPVDGLTPEQRFFVGMAQWACGFDRPENLRAESVTAPHSPYEARINGVVSNMPEFRNAFGCSEGQPMAPAKSCKVW